MNDNEPKPGVVIDVAPDVESPSGDNADPGREQVGTPVAGGTRSRWALAVALLALLGAIALGWFGDRYATDIGADIANLERQLRETQAREQTLQASVADASEALRAQQTSLAEQRQLLSAQHEAVEQARAAFVAQEQLLADENLRLQAREAELRAAVDDVHRRVGRSGTEWIIAEVEYLLRIASHRLILARDTGTAQAALGLADQRLRDTRDPGWAGVRAQIARDIAKLGAFDQPDSAGIAARLAALIEQIPQLKIARATIGAERTLPETSERAPAERSWNTLLNDLWSGFRDSVRIRERDQPVQAMLAPEHQFFLYENLKLHLEAARLALARDAQAEFRSNLATAGEWLEAYFEPDSATTGALTDAIGEMLAIEIRPELPDISQSLRTLQVRQKLMDDMAVSEVAPE